MQKPCDNSSASSTWSIIGLPNKFSEFQTRMDHVEDRPRCALPPPIPFSLPPFPDHASLPAQQHPFEIPDTLSELVGKLGTQIRVHAAFFKGVGIDFGSLAAVRAPSGGERLALQRLRYAIKEGIVSQYHTTIDNLEEHDGGFNLSAYSSLGCITARQVYEELLRLEQGTEPGWSETPGFGARTWEQRHFKPRCFISTSSGWITESTARVSTASRAPVGAEIRTSSTRRPIVTRHVPIKCLAPLA